MTDAPPAPLTPADGNLQNFPDMPLEVDRLLSSELVAHPNGEVFRVAVMSWCVAWHQRPAGSLPSDDATLCRMLGFGRDLRGWKRVREAGALRGWLLCSDGRLYHPVVAGKVCIALAAKSRQKAKRDADAARLKKWRETHIKQDDETHSETASETHSETRFLPERSGSGSGSGSEQDQNGRSRSPLKRVSDEARWPYEQLEPWCTPALRQAVKIGPRSWPKWKSLVATHGAEAVLTAARAIADHEQRWAESVGTILDRSRGQAPIGSQIQSERITL